LVDSLLTSFATIAAALFVTELTDKDAILLLALATKVRAPLVFFAGATAFVATTAIFVLAGSFLVAIVPVVWIRLAGGAGMIAYGLWEARGLVGKEEVEELESKIRRAGSGLRLFLSMITSLIVLDIAGDATEILTIIFVAQYANPFLVFAGTCTGLIAATALETALGNRLGGLLSPRRIRYFSVLVFVFLGAAIILLNWF
jgi:putative Ca2+/H+ antiporter (TMEM165/GDT1 family)